MVRCTPREAISYTSDCYGGLVSDSLIEDSKLLGNSTFSSGGIIITHSGIMVQNLFAIKM